MSLPPFRHGSRAVRLRLLSLTVGGLGDLRPAPGTWGSLPPVAVAAALIAAGAGTATFTAVMLALAVAFTVACALFGDEAEARYRKKDPSRVVADETAGMAVALLAFPAAHDAWPALLAIAFFAFRGFDIVKPPPARQMQHIRGGWGIVLDDIAAGVMTLAVVQIAAALI